MLYLRIRTQRCFSVTLLCGLLWSPRLLPAQSPSNAGQNPPGEPEGITRGGYLVHSSGEVGYRSTEVSRSTAMYDTLVNLQSGPRILDQTLSMQSLDHLGCCSTIFISTARDGEAIPITTRVCVWTRTSGTTCDPVFAATRISSTSTCWRIR
jgi:hypothetical protein